MNTATIYRQGDVLLIARKSIPDGATQEERCILAYGEATGHHHQVRDGGTIWVDVADNDRRYLQITKDAQLVHEEHATIDLKGPAVYEIIIQREYTPTAIRNVVD